MIRHVTVPVMVASAARWVAEGSMGPKVAAACHFARHTGHVAAIGALDEIDAVIAGSAGTQVTA